MGRLPQKFFWNIIGTKSFPRRKWFRFQNFLRLRTARKLCLSPAHHHYCLQCHCSLKKTPKTQEISIKYQIPALYKAPCSACSHLAACCFPALVSMLFSLRLSAAFLADTARTAHIHPSSTQGVLQSENLCIYWWLPNDVESFRSWQCSKYC